MEQEIYKSSTHGDIPLSFTGRRFLANLRDAIVHAIAAEDFNADNMAVSRARGDIAQHMSKLEGKQHRFMDYQMERRLELTNKERGELRDQLDKATSRNSQADAWEIVRDVLRGFMPKLVFDQASEVGQAVAVIRQLQKEAQAWRRVHDALGLDVEYATHTGKATAEIHRLQEADKKLNQPLSRVAAAAAAINAASEQVRAGYEALRAAKLAADAAGFNIVASPRRHK